MQVKVEQSEAKPFHTNSRASKAAPQMDAVSCTADPAPDVTKKWDRHPLIHSLRAEQLVWGLPPDAEAVLVSNALSSRRGRRSCSVSRTSAPKREGIGGGGAAATAAADPSASPFAGCAATFEEAVSSSKAGVLSTPPTAPFDKRGEDNVRRCRRRRRGRMKQQAGRDDWLVVMLMMPLGPRRGEHLPKILLVSSFAPKTG